MKVTEHLATAGPAADQLRDHPAPARRRRQGAARADRRPRQVPPAVHRHHQPRGRGDLRRDAGRHPAPGQAQAAGDARGLRADPEQVPHRRRPPHPLPGFTREETEDFLIELRYLGIDNVLAVRGDDSGFQKPLQYGRSANRYACDLVAQIAAMNRGRYLEEDLLDAEPTSFCVGVGGYPEKHFEAANLRLDVRRVKEKVEAGAHYVVTQMFFDNRHYFQLRRPLPRAGDRRADHSGPEDPDLGQAAELDPAQLLRRGPRRRWPTRCSPTPSTSRTSASSGL